eukprot:jgi/Chlat1/1136/Chrsp111S08645
MLTTQDDPLSSAVRPQAPAGDNSDGDNDASNPNNYAGQGAAAAAATASSSGKEAEDSKAAEDSEQSKHKTEEGLDLRHFMACGPHCAKPAGECATSPTQLSCRGGMAVAHYVCALRWLAKRRTHKCEICGQIVANIRTADVMLFAGRAINFNVNNNATTAGLHEPKKAIIVAASLLGLHIISLPCIVLRQVLLQNVAE